MTDTVYLKNGKFICGKLIEIKDNQYNIKSIEGYVFYIPADDVDRFVITEHYGKKIGRPEGLGFSIQWSILSGFSDYTPQRSVLITNDNSAILISITPMITYTFNKILSLSAGAGFEYYERPMAPLFAECKINFSKGRFTPFCYVRGGGDFNLIPDGGGDDYHDYKTGWSYGGGAGISIPLGNREFHLQAGYKYAYTRYLSEDFNGHTLRYQMYENICEFYLLDITMGFKF
ncbi:MAG: hypothetical protein NT092_12395 [Bacteroidia bacterium]|nr:hypothetical protein [Bacteroidia bacterium]